jgi:hypothetical protein
MVCTCLVHTYINMSLFIPTAFVRSVALPPAPPLPLALNLWYFIVPMLGNTLHFFILTFLHLNTWHHSSFGFLIQFISLTIQQWLLRTLYSYSCVSFIALQTHEIISPSFGMAVVSPLNFSKSSGLVQWLQWWKYLAYTSSHTYKIFWRCAMHCGCTDHLVCLTGEHSGWILFTSRPIDWVAAMWRCSTVQLAYNTEKQETCWWTNNHCR